MSIRVEPDQLISISTEVNRLKSVIASQLEVIERIERNLDSSLRSRARIDEQLHRLSYVLGSKVRQLEALEHKAWYESNLFKILYMKYYRLVKN